MALGNTQFRDKETVKYDTFYLDNASPVQFQVYEYDKGVKNPWDATTASSIILAFYNADSDASARETFTMTVQTDVEPGTSVQNVVEGTVLLTSAADSTTGEKRCKLLATVSGTVFVLGKPWKVNIYDGGPTS